MAKPELHEGIFRMRKLVTLVASLLILSGAYYAAFGVPAYLEDVVGLQAGGSEQADKTGGSQQGAGKAGGAKGANATAVVLTPLEMQPYEDILRAVGSASALRSANVIARVSGEVVATNLAANRLVSVGDVLVQLDARAQVYNLEIAQTELEQANETMERYERLRATGNSTVTDVTLSQARVAQRLAEAKVGLAKVALGDRTIRAPISGKLGLSDVEIGDVVHEESVVVTIDDSESLLVEFELPERSVGLLAREQRVLANTPSFVGRTFEGEIVAFDSRIDTVTRSVTVKALVENPDALLWPGMTFSVRIFHESEPLAVLPSTAITWSRSGSSIWISNDGVVEPVAVTILFRRGDQVWIEADIAPGTLVVAEGAHKLRPGARITAANSPVREPENNAPEAEAQSTSPDVGQLNTQTSPETEEPT